MRKKSLNSTSILLPGKISSVAEDSAFWYRDDITDRMCGSTKS